MINSVVGWNDQDALVCRPSISVGQEIWSNLATFSKLMHELLRSLGETNKVESIIIITSKRGLGG